MGYYTNYQVHATEDQIARLSEISEYSFSRDGALDNAKWYDWKKDMYVLSVEFPDTLFLVEGVGEEQGDYWKAYFKNKQMQFCPARITYEPFNPEFLVTLFE